jgi:hypothetical protein
MLPAVLAIVVSLAGSPVVSVVCGLACETASATPAEGGHHHDHGAPAGDAAVTAVHSCNPNVTADPFLLQGSTNDRPSEPGPFFLISPEMMAPAQATVAKVWAASRDVGDTLHRPPAVLRI